LTLRRLYRTTIFRAFMIPSGSVARMLLTLVVDQQSGKILY
jgi:hypothetical protein